MEGLGDTQGAQLLQNVVTVDPRIEIQRETATENLTEEINHDLPNAENQGASCEVDLPPILGAGVEGILSNPFIPVEGNSIESQVVKEDIVTPQDVAEKRQQQISKAQDSQGIDIQVQSVPISAVSPKRKNNLIKEASINQPRILHRNKNKAVMGQQDDSSLPVMQLAGAMWQEKEAHGLRPLVEPTRQEKKRLLLESTKLKRKMREQAQSKGAKAGFAKPKATITNEEGLVEIQVEFQHCSRIAEATSFQIDQVTYALIEDNEERAHVLIDHDPNYVPEDITSIFDPLSEDEDDSDEELQ